MAVNRDGGVGVVGNGCDRAGDVGGAEDDIDRVGGGEVDIRPSRPVVTAESGDCGDMGHGTCGAPL